MISLYLDINFHNTHNINTLGIVDTSRYPSNFTIINPTIEITPPSFDKKNIVFHTNSFNIFNSNTLGLTCGNCEYTPLPDGIWNVKYSVAPAAENFVERSFLRVDSLKAKMEKVFLSTDMTECDGNVKWQKMQEINQMEIYIEAAIAAANKCNNILAMHLYTIANKMINNFLKRC